jgi:lipopolysaccharide/colanic/teichoic acid biosynthesis glycosyltransferase
MNQNSPDPQWVEQPARFDRTAFNFRSDRTRHMGELVIACVLLVATFPLMVVVALAIKLESPGPILDRCDCVGRGNCGFQMLKFRTAYLQGGSRGSAAQLTRVGGLLQYTRIDALPQLINVLRNEMSIIDTGAHARFFLD